VIVVFHARRASKLVAAFGQSWLVTRASLCSTRAPAINIDPSYSDYELSLRHGAMCLIKATISASVLSPAS
jgi:hypothetical protein